jgi:outer membrane protein TolC
MKPQATIWCFCIRRRTLAPAVLIACCFIAGCHSTTFGEMIHEANEDATQARATFGQPSIITDGPAAVQQVGLINVQLLWEGEAPAEPEVPKNNASVKDPDSAEAPLSQPAIENRFIDLTTALRRAGFDNPTVALAEEAVRARLVEQTLVRALLFPTLNAGMNLRVHRDAFLTGRGVAADVNLQSLYWGMGADAKGGGTVAVPGLRLVGHLADAFYAPQAVQQKVVQSQYDANSTRLYVLMEVGVRYLALVEAHVSLEAYRQSLKDFEEIERLALNFAQKGQGREADAQRAKSETLLLRAEAQRAEETIGTAGAELARLLNLDPGLAMRPVDLVPPLLELVAPDLSVEQLLDQAMTNHPEIAARSADVAYQEIRLRQERARPFLPVISVGFSAGEFGGSGPDTKSRLSQFVPRTDLDIVAVWSLQNLGVGNRAIQKVTRSELESAQIEFTRVIDRIRREVVEGSTRSDTYRNEILLARKRVETSQRAYTEDLTRARNGQGRPLEVLSSASQLSAARQTLIRAMISYSQAQLQLYAALGNPTAR